MKVCKHENIKFGLDSRYKNCWGNLLGGIFLGENLPGGNFPCTIKYKILLAKKVEIKCENNLYSEGVVV